MILGHKPKRLAQTKNTRWISPRIVQKTHSLPSRKHPLWVLLSIHHMGLHKARAVGWLVNSGESVAICQQGLHTSICLREGGYIEQQTHTSH
ncbi:hypothetical protein ABBQ38_004632 [Trebouxia sp. C0009 RCD-2024]